MQEEIVSDKLTRAEVKDCAYARLCRKGNVNTVILLAVFCALVAFVYLVMRYSEYPNAYMAFYLIAAYAPAAIASLVYNCVNLHKLYANYEGWALVDCTITYKSNVTSGLGMLSNRYDAHTVEFAFTTADGNAHTLPLKNLKISALIAAFHMERYNGEAQFLYDAKNNLLYPFTPLPPRSVQK